MKDVLEFDLAGIEADVFSSKRLDENESRLASFVDTDKIKEYELDINFSNIKIKQINN